MAQPIGSFTVGSLIPGLSPYSPISTLERQYEGHTQSSEEGKRYLFLQANANCCISVEEVLRMARKQPQSPPTTQAVLSPGPDSETTADPFAFLPDAACATDTTSPETMQKKSRFGKFFQSIKDTGSHAITAGMHQLAVRNDSKDCLVIVAMDEQSVIIGVTEAKVMGEQNSIVFSIPIPFVSTLTKLTLHLCVKSTAALVASKHYWIGQVNVSLTNNVHQEISVQSPIINDGKLTCDLVRDGKYMNWSLADPTPLNTTDNSFHNVPLDQRYAFADDNGKLLVATERTVESTLIVPVAAALSTIYDTAARQSMRHAQESYRTIHAYRQSTAPNDRPYADVQVRISHWQTNMASSGLTGRPTVLIFYQRPDSMFETTILEATACPLYPSAADGFRTPISPRFYANGINPQDIMPALQHSNGPAFGTLRLEVAMKTADGETIGDVMECFISLESHIIPSEAKDISPKHNNREYKIVDRKGHSMGNLVLSLTVVPQQTEKVPAPPSPLGDGLVELMGLLPVTDGIMPNMDLPDYCLDTSKSVLQRRQQLKVLGICYTSEYLEQHMNQDRAADLSLLADRATQYKNAIKTAMQQMNGAKANESREPVYADRNPRPFRPSSSRTTEHLAGLGFNVHTASFSLTHNTTDDPRHPSLATFHNVTCGAPADHARGFGKLYDAPGTNVVVAGGLRRLEASRQTLGQHITALQNALSLKALRYLEDESKALQRQVTHISPNIDDLRNLRWKLFEAIQCLHSLTWTCSVRRTSVFSQALGIALTSYMASISDPNKCNSQWPEVWSRNGFLVSYEGLLSAAGKELGMIEDAAVGIDMLRRVRVILAPDDGGFAKNPNRVPVPYSQCINWIHLWTAREREGAPLEFCLQVGIEMSYFTQRIPPPLKNGTAVRLLGTLFEVGVDIFQAASNAGSNLNKNMSSAACNPVDVNDVTIQDYSVKDVLSDDEETVDADDDDGDAIDTSGISGTDALVQLNYEAFQKLNAYAHAVSPVAPPKTGTHPMLATLYQHIASSAGKVNHDILVEASMLAQQLGGGGVVFCKSGKDRTAMHGTC